MANVTPILQKKKVVKRAKKFARYQAHQFMRVDPSWRAPRGIDGRFRRRFKGTGPHVKIGYGTDAKTKHTLPSGFKKFIVHNVEDVDLLLMHNRVYSAEIAHNVSSRKRKDILARAGALNVRVTNAKARMEATDDE